VKLLKSQILYTFILVDRVMKGCLSKNKKAQTREAVPLMYMILGVAAVLSLIAFVIIIMMGLLPNK